MSTIDRDDKGPLIGVAMWITLVSSCLAGAGKLYTKWSATKRLMSDDYMFIFALLATIAMTIAINEQTKFGLGKTSGVVSRTEIESQLKARYASSILYIVSIYTTKLITLLFFTCIAVTNTGKKVLLTLKLFLLVWLVVLIITTIFQCRPPAVWDIQHGSCIDFTALGTFNLVIDVCSQAAISFLPIYLLHTLEINKKSKQWTTMFAFTPNVVGVPLASLRYFYLRQAFSSPDTIQGSYNLILLEALHALIGLTAACLPFTKPIIDSLISEAYLIINESGGPASSGYPSGIFIGEAFRSRSYYSRKHSVSLSKDKSRGAENDFRWPQSFSPSSATPDMLGEAVVLGNISTVSTRHQRPAEAIVEERSVEDERDGSLDRMVIYHTTTADVSSQMK